MKNIPKKYFKADNIGLTLLMIRQFLASGRSVEQLASEITNYYHKAAPKDKMAMGELLTAVYDFADTDTAFRCGKMFEVFPLGAPDPRYPISYQIVRNHFDSPRVPWLDYYLEPYYRVVKYAVEFDTNHYWWVVAPSEKDCVNPMGDSMYWALEYPLTINFLAIEDCPRDILIDEEIFMDEEAPIYFTDVSHFTSPVYKVKVAKKILEYCLQRIGFPKVEIKTKVLFSSPEAKLMNKEDYMEGGAQAAEWKGIELFEYRNINKHSGFILHDCISIEKALSESEETEKGLIATLMASMHVTTAIFKELYTSKQLVKNSPRQLNQIVKKLGVFEVDNKIL